MADRNNPPSNDLLSHGHVWAVRPSARWRPATGKTCRFVGGHPREHCGAPSAAEMNRERYTRTGRVESWWAYCSDHMYGNWIDDDGVVVRWSVVQVAVANEGGDTR